jgi:hypothetical protein
MDGDGGYGAFTSLSNLESFSSEHFDLFKSQMSTFSTMYDLILEESIFCKTNKS